MISVIIPTWNEEENLPQCVAALRENRTSCEILVVDGGSTDRTPELGRELGTNVITSPVRQRAVQLNLGAQHARGTLFLFLHADTLVPRDALLRVESALQDENVGGGAFARRFNSPSAFLRFTCALAELRNHAIGWHLGDQAIFVRRTNFEQLRGFRDLRRFEDLDFSRRLAGTARLVTLRPHVLTSARRFTAEGPVRRTFRDLALTFTYLRLNLHRAP